MSVSRRTLCRRRTRHVLKQKSEWERCCSSRTTPGQTVDTGRTLLEFAPLLVELLASYPEVEIVLMSSPATAKTIAARMSVADWGSADLVGSPTSKRFEFDFISISDNNIN